LCQKAAALLFELGCHFQAVDIAYDDELFIRYGVTIPVLKYGDDEINWPFTSEQLQIWLKTHGVNYDS
jgi:glutaredoxin